VAERQAADYDFEADTAPTLLVQASSGNAAAHFLPATVGDVGRC
jgi:hypothetical protein